MNPMKLKGEHAEAVARLMQQGREARKLTKKAAASAARISEGRWRQLEKGIEMKGGKEFPASTRAETLVLIARAVDITPADLLVAGGYSAADADKFPEGPPVEVSAPRELDVSHLTDSQIAQVEAFIAGLRMRG